MRKILLGALALVAVAAGAGWLFRADILTQIVLYQAGANKREIGPEKQITWEQGPSEPSAPLNERPPNIVFILLDDLGYNDISTFGGGVAGGKVPTHNIDRLAHAYARWHGQCAFNDCQRHRSVTDASPGSQS